VNTALARNLRLPLGFLLGITYVVFARPTVRSLVIGGVIAFLGILIRAWASGHITKNKVLATSGPYAYTRNPLYLGSFLIAAGFALAAHWSLLVAVIVFFLVIYYPTMQREIGFISQYFPDNYPQYASNVPLFVPRLTPWRGDVNSNQPFSFALYMRHKEWRAALTYVLAMIWLALRAAHT
jgi:protein-S-isoprenylcysteine O-methyltransferase Ste14